MFDPTTGQPLVWYEGSGTGGTSRRYLSSDERGSIISVTSSTGASLAVNSYDEYGIPGPANLGRHGYTGQAWLPSIGVWYYKARVYHPALRFLQPDPIGYAGGINLYAYVGNDPVNFIDPLGLGGCDGTDPTADCRDIVIVAGHGVLVGFPGGGRYQPRMPNTDQEGGSTSNDGQPATDQKEKSERKRENEICRGAVTGTFTFVLGVGAVETVVLEGQAHSDFGDYARAAGRGAHFGARFGLVGAASGAVILAGGLYVWDRYHKEIMDALCNR